MATFNATTQSFTYAPGEHERILKWQDAIERRRENWRQRKEAGRGRNLGPCPGLRPWGLGRPRTIWFVVRDVPLAAGAIVNGEPVPAGSYLSDVPIGGPCYSRGQVLKAWRRALVSYPDAKPIGWRSLASNERANGYRGSLVLGTGEPAPYPRPSREAIRRYATRAD